MIIAILGPTAVGKTALSIALAKKYNAEVINFDAMQVYVKLDIGTAKVTKEEMEGVPHHLLSNVSLEKNYSVYDYQKDARHLIDKLLKENKNIILVGGTGLYLKATLYDYNFTEGTTYKEYNDLTNEEILNKIKSYNVEELPHINNRKRLVRLLNKLENNETITNNGNNLLYKDTIFIGLTTDRNTLYDKINKRVDVMFNNGLLEEVESLKDEFNTSKALNTAIGYKEFIPYFNHEKTLDEIKDDIKKNSRHYAKRQYTFFIHQFNLRWFNTNYDDFNKTINEVINYIENIKYNL
ncbi:MAG TPA: tRNA (adenosine(37)-N6)-dimethylallyltransferase MiaA [Candidatus Onthousia excrementipullorum]|uniref:tRNA dimethylallyltransferase n=1 Tax=Candidatus Onthousia excrementipullorum TaxID=2840884 RepID=A0A9D1J361_9FIRM|nr:tRNA (adenosine(37)-N6)-dimethylallyltransferase MiaA [Candidatus Onthousia excrementipullorum]